MFEQLDLPQQNMLAYICGYLCKRVLPNHECDRVCSQCRKALLNEEAVVGDPRLNLIHYKAYEINGRNFGFLKVPSTKATTALYILQNL